MGSSDSFCAKWDCFEANIITSFNDFREHSEFFDITLCCDNGIDTIPAHKVILAGCSPLFRNILSHQENVQSPFLYLKGIHLKELQALLDLIYNGEVVVAKDSLNDFLEVVEELGIRGLTNDFNPIDTEKLEKKKKAAKKRKSIPAGISLTPKAFKKRKQNQSFETDHEATLDPLLEHPIKSELEPEPSGSGFYDSHFLASEGFDKSGYENKFDTSAESTIGLEAANNGKRTHTRHSLEEQLDILRRFDNGEKTSHIAKDLGIPESTIRNVVKRREKLNKFKRIRETFGASNADQSTKTKIRSTAIETMERLLISWIENCNQQGVCLDQAMIQAKARNYYQKVRDEQTFSEMSQEELKESFSASKGWFDSFKRRTGVYRQRSLDDQSGSLSKKTTFTAVKD